MLKAKNVDILNGDLLKNIIIYSVPIMLVGLIQNLFHSVDLMVLRVVASDNEVAAVGAPTQIISLLVNTFFGISGGVKIVLARFLGAKEEQAIKKTVSTAIVSAFVIGVLVAIVGVSLSPTFLRLTKCPDECFDGALTYMRIFVAAAPATLMYNFGSAIINTTGDSQRPLYYMIASGLLNITLNFALCMIIPQKVAAVAIATVASNMLGAILVVRRLCKLDGICRLDLRKLSWNRKAFGRIFVNGAPIAISSALFPLANLQIQTAINSYGTVAIAGNSAAISLETMISPIATSAWSASCTVFVGQNLGAKNNERVKKSIKYHIILALFCGLVLGITAFSFSRHLLSLFVASKDAIAYGRIRTMYILLPYAVGSVYSVLSHIIQGFGYAICSSATSIVCVFGFRIFWMNFIYPIYPSFSTLMQCFIVSWLLMLAVYTVIFLYLYFAKFKKGTLKKII